MSPRALLEGLLRRLAGRAPPGFTEAALLAAGTAAFRDIAVPHADGTVHVVAAHRYSAAFRAEHAELVRVGALPPPGRLVPVEPAEIARMRAADAADGAERDRGALTRGARLVEAALAAAAGDRASDLKIMSGRDDCRVRARIAGRDVEPGAPWTCTEGMEALRHVFNARDGRSGHLDIVDYAFQSFSVTPGMGLALPASVVKLRGQRGAHETGAGLGSHMVLRLFYRDADHGAATLDGLGFDARTHAALAQVRQRLKGAIIIGGETGDGKSTTLVRAIETLAAEHGGTVAIATVEDPVEYLIEAAGVVQVPIPSAGGGAERQERYHDALRHFVRINPDVGVISEIRDSASAREALRFVDTGHMVWTTIHADNANAILFRLIDLGVPASEIAKPGQIALLMKQTLVPLLCRACARAENPDPDGLLPDGPVTGIRWRGPGCAACQASREAMAEGTATGRRAWAGYTRLSAVAETIVPDRTYMEHVRACDAWAALEHWITVLGGVPLARTLEDLVRAGDLDPRDALRKGAIFGPAARPRLAVVEGERQ